MQQSLSSSSVVARSAAFNILGYGSSALYVFLLVPLLVHFVGTEAFGLWSLMLALTGYLGLADLGLATSFTKHIAEYASSRDFVKVNQVVLQGLLFYGLLCVVFLAVGAIAFPFLFSLLRIPQAQYDLARLTFLLCLVSFGASSLGSVFASVLSGIQRTDMLNVIMACSFAVKLIAIAITLSMGFGLPGMVITDIITSVLTFLPLYLATRKCLPQVSLRPHPYDHALMKKLLRFGTHLQVSRVAEVIQLQFDKLLITRFVGLPFVSLYDFGSRPLSRLRALPVAAVGALVPAISELQTERNDQRIASALARSTKYLSIVSLPLFGFLLCFAHDIIDVWLGTGFDMAATTMQILATAYCINVIASPLAFVSQGTGETRYQMWSATAQALLNIALSTSLMLRYGYFGAVTGTAISMCLGMVMFIVWYGKRILKKPLLVFFQAMQKPMLNSIITLGLLMALSSLLPEDMFGASRLVAGLELIGGFVLFLCMYVAMLRWTKSLSTDDKHFLDGIVPKRWKGLLRVL